MTKKASKTSKPTNRKPTKTEPATLEWPARKPSKKGKGKTLEQILDEPTTTTEIAAITQAENTVQNSDSAGGLNSTQNDQIRPPLENTVQNPTLDFSTLKRAAQLINDNAALLQRSTLSLEAYTPDSDDHTTARADLESAIETITTALRDTKRALKGKTPKPQREPRDRPSLERALANKIQEGQPFQLEDFANTYEVRPGTTAKLSAVKSAFDNLRNGKNRLGLKLEAEYSKGLVTPKAA